MIVARDFGSSIADAWMHLGYPPLTPRRLRALTLAVRELWAVDEAVEDIGKTRGKGDKPPSVQNVLLAASIGRTYQDWLDAQDTAALGATESAPEADETAAPTDPALDLGPPDADGLVGFAGDAVSWVPIGEDDPMIQTRGGA